MLQDTHLFTGTILDNIRYGRLDATDEECIAAAKSANAHSFIRRLPQGYQTMVSGDGGNLSQGQRQLLAIARAAVADPPVMILDEATSGLDPVVRDEILDEFLAFIQDEEHAILLSSHITSDLEKVADYVTYLHRGRVAVSGAKDELLDTYGKLVCGRSELERVDPPCWWGCAPASSAVRPW